MHELTSPHSSHQHRLVDDRVQLEYGLAGEPLLAESPHLHNLLDHARRGRDHALVQDTVAAVAVLVTIGATLCVAYWRMALRVLLIAAIAVAVSGVVAVIYGLVWLVTRLHA